MPEFSLVGDALAYVFPSDHGTACVAVTVPADSGTSAGDYDTLVGAHPDCVDGRSVPSRSAGSWWAPRATTSCTTQPGLAGLSSATPAPTRTPGPARAWTRRRPRQAAALAATLTDDPAGWNADYAQARDGVTLERFDTTVRLAPDLRRMLAEDGESA